MDRITRVTVVYDPEEDRLALDVENQHQVRRRLWLTRRLLDQLIPALLQPLGHSTATVEQPTNAPAPPEARQVYAQLAARLQHKPAQPVSPPEGPATLVQEVLVARRQNGPWRLTFRRQGAEPAELALPDAALRQWLEALHRNYLKAGWGNAIWPDWVGNRRAPAPVSGPPGKPTP